MNNAPTPEGRGQDRPNDAEPLFPSEGPFNPVVPLAEVGQAPAPAVLPTVNPADVGKPAEAAWAREAHRARLKEEEVTLVPSRAARARGERPSWLVTASVVVISAAAGLASGTYLIWSSQRAQQSQPPARVATETPGLAPATGATPAPAEKQEAPVTKVAGVDEPVKDEKPSEAAKAEKSVEAAPAPSLQPARRAERGARAAEASEVTPARSRGAALTRTRPAVVAQDPPGRASSERTPPISSPPPTAKSKKVIQWP